MKYFYRNAHSYQKIGPNPTSLAIGTIALALASTKP